ncbi:MAG: metallophosphoesterase, partial [Clostridia bacterium]|nr:metallophosphoesterase [Clostridia bacterium]
EKVEYSNEHNYYDAWVDGHHYIFLEMPKIPSPNYAFGEEQLAWLDKKLYENESTGKPVFIFTHVPTESNVNASFTDNQIRDDADFKAVLAKHPTAIVVSGHTHYSLDIDAYSSHNGAQEEFSVIHDGGTTTINVPNGSDYEDTTEIAGSHGIIAEVYADRILLRGRDFASDKWLSKGYTLLTFKDAPDFEVTAERSTDESGNTVLTASNVSSDYTCTWIVDGAETAGASVTLTGDADYAALRITDKNGLYASMLYDDISDIPEKKQSSLEVQNGVVKVTGVTNPSYLIIVSYKGTRLHDVYIKPVSDNINVNISETTLDTSGCDKITAIVLKKTSLSPLFPAVSQ